MNQETETETEHGAPDGEPAHWLKENDLSNTFSQSRQEGCDNGWEQELERVRNAVTETFQMTKKDIDRDLKQMGIADPDTYCADMAERVLPTVREKEPIP